MNKKLFSLIVVFAAIASSCGINDLEDRLDKVEDALGTNEPMIVNFSTKDDQDRDIILKTDFLFKSKGYNSYMELYPENEIYVEAIRFSDVDWNEGAEVSFSYNTVTKEVENISAEIYFYNKYGRWTRVYFGDGYSGHTSNLKVNSVNTDNGTVDIELTVTTTPEGENEFSGKAMNLTIKFKGRLDTFDYTDTSNL
jgi:hypothetical protein